MRNSTKVNRFKLGFRILLLFALSFFALINPNFFSFLSPKPHSVAYAASNGFVMPKSWGGQNCDPGHYGGSEALQTMQGVSVCIGLPLGTSNVDKDVPEVLDGITMYEWECVEFVMRYIYLVDKQPIWKVAYGKDVANSYKGSYFQKENNPAKNIIPSPGDIISFGVSSSSPYGHVGIIHTSTVNSSGNGSIVVYSQNLNDKNNKPLPPIQITVSNWQISTPPDGLGSVTKWLHNPRSNPSPGSLSLTNGINSPSSQLVLGQPIPSNYNTFTVTNNGGSSFTLSELNLWATDPNGNTFKVYGDANSTPIGAGQSRTLTIPSGTNFGSNCGNCVPGTYALNAYYQENGPPVTLNTMNGGNNPFQVSVQMAPITIGHPDAAYNSNGITQAFKDVGGHILTNWQNGAGGAWVGWRDISSGTMFNGDPSIGYTSAGGLQAFARNNNNFIVTTWQSNPGDNTSWGNWGLLFSGDTYQFASDPVVVNQSNGLAEVYALGFDGNLWHTYTANGAWTGWSTIGTGTYQGSPTIVQNQFGGEQVFIRGTDNTIYTNWQQTPGNQNSWTGWSHMISGDTFQAASNPVAALQSDGLIDVFARGMDNNLYHNYIANGAWSGWGVIGANQYTLTNDPTVVQNQSGALQVFATANGNKVYSAWESNPSDETSWTGWSVTDTNLRTASSPIVLRQSSGLYDIFATSMEDGYIWLDHQTDSSHTTTWMSLGILPGRLDTSYNIDGSIQAFKRTSIGGISTDWQTNGTWQGWQDMSGGNTFNGDPSIGYTSVGGLQAFARNSNNFIVTTWQNIPGDNASWGNWGLLFSGDTYQFASDPVVVNQSDGLLDVYALGLDGNLWHNYIANGTWSGWTTLGSGSFQGKPTIVQNQFGGIQVFIRGTDNTIYTNWQQTPGNQSSWTGWSHVTGGDIFQAASNPVAALQSDGQIDVFARGMDNNLYHNYINVAGNAWSGWEAIGANQYTFAGDPSVTQNSGGSLQVFIEASNGYLYSAWQNVPPDDYDWTNWSVLSNSQITSNVAATRQTDALMNVFVYGIDSDLWYLHQSSPTSWSNWVGL